MLNVTLTVYQLTVYIIQYCIISVLLQSLNLAILYLYTVIVGERVKVVKS